jgi:3'(2'), 5'-bisphosphate nucleotidase
MHTDVQVARLIANEAGAVLLSLREQGAKEGWDPKDLKDRGDMVSHQLIMQRFAELRPNDAVLSEEGADDPVRLSAERVWIVDPLDGTREYSEAGRDDWAVHIALTIAGVVQFGVVELPAVGQSYDERAVVHHSQVEAPRILVSRTRPPVEASIVAEAIGGVLVPMGSAGAKTAAILRGEAELYIHSGGQFEWDLAAPVGVALSAGLHASRIDGSAFVFNCENPYLPDALIGHPELARRALQALGVLS